MVERKKGGSIINIGSMYGDRGSVNSTIYSVSKAGVHMLTKMSALALGKSNIRVNAIAPGPVNTERIAHFLSDPENRKKLEATVPLGRINEPRDIGNAALFLASDASNTVSGAIVVVDAACIAGAMGAF
jgi:3-oxoacyl-[acyl-carrier protein] reductase